MIFTLVMPHHIGPVVGCVRAGRNVDRTWRGETYFAGVTCFCEIAMLAIVRAWNIEHSSKDGFSMLIGYGLDSRDDDGTTFGPRISVYHELQTNK